MLEFAEIVSRGGTPVEHVRTVHIPDDETCFHFFEAASAEAVGAAGKQAGLVFDRITKSLPGRRSPDFTSDSLRRVLTREKEDQS